MKAAKRLLAIWPLLLAINVWADGETILFHKQADDFDIALFSHLDAMRAGKNDVSVLIQDRGHSTVMNATVLLHLSQIRNMGEITRLTSIATHAKATNKTMYGAPLNIPATGKWNLQVEVSNNGKTVSASTEISVLPPLPPVVNYWPYVAMVPALGVAFLINRKLRERYRVKSRA